MDHREHRERMRQAQAERVAQRTKINALAVWLMAGILAYVAITLAFKTIYTAGKVDAQINAALDR